MKQSGNPFAYFVIAHLKTLETYKDPRQRMSYKEEITLELLKQELDEEVKKDLLLFIDLLMALPRKMEEEFRQTIHEYKEKNKMPLVSPFERYYTEQGNLEEARSALLDNLKVRFGELPVSLSEKVQSLKDLSFLRKLRLQVFETSSLEEFNRLILEHDEKTDINDDDEDE